MNCLDYIFIEKYRQLFGEHIEQAIDYIQNLKDEDFKAKVRLLSLSFESISDHSSRLILSLNYYLLYGKSRRLYGTIESNKSNKYI